MCPLEKKSNGKDSFYGNLNIPKKKKSKFMRFNGQKRGSDA